MVIVLWTLVNKEYSMLITLEDFKKELQTHEDYNSLTQSEWEEKIIYRDIVKRSQKDFDYFKPMYLKKIGSIREQLKTEGVNFKVVPLKQDGSRMSDQEVLDNLNQQMDNYWYWLKKEKRLFDKLAVVLKEEEYRKEEIVERTGIHDAADYYIDYDNGNDSNDGLSIGNAWKTLLKYTTETARSPGDRAFLRAGITWDQGTEATDIVFDEDGDQDNWISIIGCDSVTNDPWSDSNDTKPIIDFEDAAYQFLMNADSNWWIERLDMRQSNDSNGLFYAVNEDIVYFKDCDWSDNASSNVEGIYLTSIEVTFDGCTFTDCYGRSIFSNNATIHIKNCTIDAGSIRGSVSALYNGGVAFIENTSIAPSNAFSSSEIECQGYTYLQNCVFGVSQSITVNRGGILYSEDDDGVFEAHTNNTREGIISRQTASPRSGGADSYAKMLPNADCGSTMPLVFGTPLKGFAQVWLEASVEKTITVYARVGSAWDSALTASEAFLRASYLDSAGDCGRTVVESTEQITNDAAWTAFSVTFTPLKAGFVYLWFVLAEYEDATEYIDVDIKAVIS